MYGVSEDRVECRFVITSTWLCLHICSSLSLSVNYSVRTCNCQFAACAPHIWINNRCFEKPLERYIFLMRLCWQKPQLLGPLCFINILLSLYYYSGERSQLLRKTQTWYDIFVLYNQGSTMNKLNRSETWLAVKSKYCIYASIWLTDFCCLSTVVCFDAKINFDDNAEFRQKAVFAMDDTAESDPTETEAAKYDLKYIGLDGNIACFGLF